MVFSKEELIWCVGDEVRVITHLIDKADAGMLEYRPTPKQRSLLELLRYLAIFAPIQLDLCLAPKFDFEAMRQAWNSEEARTKNMSLAEAREEITRQAGMFSEKVGKLSDSDLREEINLFGSNATRGAWLVRMILQHYAAYRMQVFLYLKAAGREELNTMNLWMGVDGTM